jgi:ADP-heptose:LPS heptosyltransferase
MGKNEAYPAGSYILLTRFSALGDVAMVLPLVYDVCNAFGHLNFVFVTKSWPATMFVNQPSNLTVIGVDFDSNDKYKGIKGVWSLARELYQKYHFVAMGDLHGVLRSRIISTYMRLHHVPVIATIDKEHSKREALTRRFKKKFEPLMTQHDRYRRVFGNLRTELGDDFTSILKDKTFDSPLVPVKEEGQRWIAISPFSQHKGKEYPMELMSKVIDTIAGWDNTTIFLFGGGKREKLLLRPFAKQYKNVKTLAEVKHGFIDEFVLMSHCDVMLSMDSANMHLASLVGLPVVSVWGATHPYCGFLGLHQRMDDVIQYPLPCRPCSIYGSKPCHFHDYRCLTSILPSTITDHIKMMLEKKQK